MFVRRKAVEGYNVFKEKVYRKIGIDLSSYKERQMKRRIESLISRNNYDSYNVRWPRFNKISTDRSFSIVEVLMYIRRGIMWI